MKGVQQYRSTAAVGAELAVLVVDDIEDSRLELAALVRSLGYRCLLARDGQQALQLVASERPDVVLLDLLMPGLDGFAVTQQLRESVRDRWLPVIVTSALEGEEHFIAALSQGADDYLSRPVRPALLAAKLLHYRRVLVEQRRMDRMKDEFLATVSHELRTPLTSVIGALGLLGSGAAGALTAPARQLAEVAQRNGERLSRLIDDVLDLTKLEGNRMVMQLRSCALAELVAEAVAANQSYAQRCGVLLELACTAETPRALVDADRLLQVLANLLSNAIKHSPPGSPVRVCLHGVAQGWRIDVCDAGPGIDPSFRQRLFDKFAQADSSDRRAHGGTGLGLYISRMLVERMGGQILVDSVPGRGSTFSVQLPLPQSAARAVLCIGRDRQRLERQAEWLAPFVRVETACDLDEALALLARMGPPAAVVADPQGQGPVDGFCLRLRQLCGVANILLTGDSIDAGYAAQQGLAWVAPAPREARRQLVDFVRVRVAATAQE